MTTQRYRPTAPRSTTPHALRSTVTYAEARDAAREMVQLTDVPVFLMADTRGPDNDGAVLVRLQKDWRREAWIPAFMCEIGSGELVHGGATTGWGPRTLTAALKVLQWKGLD